MKIGIIGHVDHGKSCLTSAIIKRLESQGAEVVQLDPDECHDRGIRLSSLIIDECKNDLSIEISRLTPQFRPPLTRAERRRLNRKKK